ncbi:Sigma-like sequence protein 1, mitochondrial [Wickerhamomyces ciferrii]|uniref:Sigma-like sequence protein 1, mitochondrial n=1 Tax=Wickerhamomyces ciferrii (strain ATCC 14091 / BCRC 22168 / CBS 111 / JCM 3599 / NBRC 0793 / NRRL Y-1031 F-60-10) TaxID=1206466 RepID=K0L0V0_WICCF|nr:Sigma-like sequence protein 1, mitochondrial [Wickerhamomyces ciferrii]CCH47078.1 Sigma-like sequence protein 1, mitochondrial [Wickerhamomyces ciferrii]
MFSACLRRRAFHTFSRALQEDIPSNISPLASTIIKQTDSEVDTTVDIKPDTVNTNPDTTVDTSDSVTVDTNTNTNINSNINTIHDSHNTIPYIKGKGKKLPHQRPNLVILNARNSNILGKKPKPVTNREPGFFILDAVELENSRKKLLQFKSNVTEDQISSSIQYIKPSNSIVSINRYEQIKNDISDAYSLSQIKGFFAKFYPDIKYKSKTKKVLINLLLDDCWKLEKSKELNAESDLLIERTFELDNVKIFLLLIQNTIQQWLRSNVQVILIPEEYQLVVRASEPHVQYIELALQNVFNNLKKEDLNIENVNYLAEKFGVQIPIDEIQRLAGVYFQADTSSSSPIQYRNDVTKYTMSALGSKRFDLAKRLIVGALGHNHFSKTTLIGNWKNSLAKFYDYSLNFSLPWNYRSKEWVRLKEPKRPLSLTTGVPPALPTIPYQDIYKSLYNSQNTADQVTDDKKTVTAVTFGNILLDKSKTDSENPPTIFQTQLPHLKDVLISLNKKSTETSEFEEEDYETEEDIEIAKAKSQGTRLDDESLDVHDYYAQMKLYPSPFGNHEDFLKHPQLEFWVELPYGKISRESLQIFRVLSEKNCHVSLPNLNTDLKFLNSETESLSKPFEGDDIWLDDQPGIKDFIKNCEIQVGQKHKVYIPKSVEVNIPGFENPVKYDYVSMAYRKHLTFEFKDRLLQFADVEGGALGGTTTELLLVGDTEEMKPEEFKKFAEDALEFAQKIKSA